MGTISYSIPQAGQLNQTEDPKVATALQTLLTWANGGIDSSNTSAVFAQSAGVNQSGQTVKVAVNIATSQSTSSTTYATLATPDQVAGIVLPTNGLIGLVSGAVARERTERFECGDLPRNQSHCCCQARGSARARQLRCN